MKRIGLLAVLVVASWSANVHADQSGRFVRVRVAQLQPGVAPVVVQDEAAPEAPAPQGDLAPAVPNAHYGYSHGFAWAQCCEVTRPCCMGLWDNYCSDVRRWCEVSRCHYPAKRYRCGSCGFGGNGCGNCSSCAQESCASCGHGGKLFNFSLFRHGRCDACDACDSCSGGAQHVAPPAEDTPPQPADLNAASRRYTNKKW